MRSHRHPVARSGLILLLLAFTLSTGGCAALTVGAATAVTVSTVQDNRTIGAQIDDEVIETKANSAINSDADLKRDAHINVTSVNGIVLLTGEVPEAELRDRVLAKVRTVDGIRRTVNEIQIGTPTSLTARTRDTWLTTKVKSRLIGTADVKSNTIKVVTEQEAVYLMGLVPRSEAETATEAARQVGGVARVVKLFEYLD
jgi:osmotically-inducible protein OsmY